LTEILELSKEEVSGVTTDNGANITCATDLLEWSNHHFPCFTYS